MPQRLCASPAGLVVVVVLAFFTLFEGPGLFAFLIAAQTAEANMLVTSSLGQEQTHGGRLATSATETVDNLTRSNPPNKPGALDTYSFMFQETRSIMVMSSNSGLPGDNLTLLALRVEGGQSVTFWLDADGDGVRDTSERDLCVSVASSDDTAACTMTVSNPPFAQGKGFNCTLPLNQCNFINFIDGKGRTTNFPLALDQEAVDRQTFELEPEADQTVNCGDTIMVGTVLDADINCVGSGLIIGADGITLDLNGHTVSGSASPCQSCPFEVGILIDGHSGITIKNGTVDGFVYGIFLQNGSHSNAVISTLTTGNIFNGISLIRDSDNNQIEGCISHNNGGFGIIINDGSDGNIVKNCSTSRNDLGVFIGGGSDGAPSFDNKVIGTESSENLRSGIDIFGGSSRNIVTGNLTNDNGTNGINLNVDATENIIEGNTSNGNDGEGIRIARESNDNAILNNNVADNGGDGIRILRNADKNVVRGNRLTGNRDGIGLARGADRNDIQDNFIFDNLRYGLRVSDVVPPNLSDPYEVDPQDNLIANNELSDNVVLDINDETTGATGTAGTKNIYRDNQCETSAPVDLCALNQPALALSGPA